MHRPLEVRRVTQSMLAHITSPDKEHKHLLQVVLLRREEGRAEETTHAFKRGKTDSNKCFIPIVVIKPDSCTIAFSPPASASNLMNVVFPQWLLTLAFSCKNTNCSSVYGKKEGLVSEILVRWEREPSSATSQKGMHVTSCATFLQRIKLEQGPRNVIMKATHIMGTKGQIQVQ